MLETESVRRRVLVIDGHVGRREERGRRFAGASYEVIYAEHAYQGFPLARRWLPDLVLLHAGLQGISATDIARRIAGDPRTRRAALVLTSEGGVVGSFRLHPQLAMKDVALFPCQDEVVRRLVCGPEGAS